MEFVYTGLGNNLEPPLTSIQVNLNNGSQDFLKVLQSLSWTPLAFNPEHCQRSIFLLSHLHGRVNRSTIKKTLRISKCVYIEQTEANKHFKIVSLGTLLQTFAKTTYVFRFILLNLQEVPKKTRWQA